MTDTATSGTVSDPPEGALPPEGWEDYEVPLTATGVVVVRAQSEAAAAEWAAVQGNDLIDHTELTRDTSMEIGARKARAGAEPENLGDDDPDLYLPAVPTMSRLREVRSQLDLTQADVADAVGVSTGTLGGWERGESSPSLEHTRSYVRFLKDAAHGSA